MKRDLSRPFSHWLAHPAAPAVVSALAALIVYALTLGGTFVYDDFDVFALDDRLRDPSQWHRYFTESYNGGVDNLYRPLVSMTYAVQWWLHGSDIAWPFHAVNWLLHAGVSALVAELARRIVSKPSPSTLGEGLGEGQVAIDTKQHQTLSPALSQSTGRGSEALAASYLAGLLFAVHPIHVEAVANIVGRAELLCALGFLGALVLFAHRLTAARSWAIFGCLVVSILSKEQGILLPAILLTMWWLRPRENRSDDERRATTLLAILVCWSVAGYIVFRESILKFSWDRSFLDWTINPLIRAEGVDRYLLPITILGRYMALLIAPIKLSPDYGSRVIGWTVRVDDPYFWLGIASIGACVFAFVVAIRMRNRAALICLIGLTLTYGLISNLVILIGTNFGERLMYLPSAFFLILVAIALVRIRIPTLLLLLLVLLLSARSVTYASRWNDRESFYRYSIANQPNSIRLRMLLIAELQSQTRLEEADDVARNARELLPEYDEIWLQSADIAEARGDFDRARKYLDHAMKMKPRNKTAMRLQLLDEKRAAARAAATQPR